MRDVGHENTLHEYTHEFVGTLSEKQQRDILTKSIDIMTKFCGKKPRGWTAPQCRPAQGPLSENGCRAGPRLERRPAEDPAEDPAGFIYWVDATESF